MPTRVLCCRRGRTHPPRVERAGAKRRSRRQLRRGRQRGLHCGRQPGRQHCRCLRRHVRLICALSRRGRRRRIPGRAAGGRAWRRGVSGRRWRQRAQRRRSRVGAVRGVRQRQRRRRRQVRRQRLFGDQEAGAALGRWRLWGRLRGGPLGGSALGPGKVRMHGKRVSSRSACESSQNHKAHTDRASEHQAALPLSCEARSDRACPACRQLQRRKACVRDASV